MQSLNPRLTAILFLAAFSGPAPASELHFGPAASDEPELIAVGDKSIKGKTLKVYDSKWSSSGMDDALRITEASDMQRQAGRRLYVRKQVFPMQSGLAMHTTISLDAQTLQTVSLQQEIVGLPEGASIGNTPVFCRWDFDGAKFKRTYRIGTETTNDEGALQDPMFDGGALGLVIAALPLRDGYTVRLPVCMPLGPTIELTRYWVDLRVVGKEPFKDQKGKSLEAWVVDVDWLDFVSKQVTSKGGYDQPGGAYFVVPKPPKGFPHVPRYANNSGVIELELE